MFKLDEIKPSNEFNYWFLPDSQNIVSVFCREDTEFICKIDITDDTIHVQPDDEISDSMKSDILLDFNEYKLHRPEYAVICNDIIDTKTMSYDDAVTMYNKLLSGCVLIKEYRNNKNPDIDAMLPKIQRCIDWLRSTDFYVAPASTIYHGSFEGGLLYHKLDVVQNIKDLSVLNKFKNVNIEDAVFVATVHDWCKINLYESYIKKAPNPSTGNWEPVKAYRRSEEIISLGHGVSSMYTALKFFKLSKEECLAIRWHMGEYNVADNEMDALHNANCKYPIVQMLQFADRLSITNY